METTSKPWTYKDVEKLRREYPVRPAKDIAKELGRSVRAIYIKVYHLGLIKDHHGTVWTPKMLTMLKALFPITFNKPLAACLGVSSRTLIRKARELGLEKKPGFLEDRKADISQLRREAKQKSTNTAGQFKKGIRYNPAGEFKKGHVESPETKAKRSAAIKESWRIRKQRAQFRRDYNINASL